MEEEQEPWEALDLDDSDLPSLLRPCNTHFRHQTSPPKSPNPTSISSSQQQHPFIHSCTQTLTSQSQHSNSPSPLPASPRLIPGPAGAVQAAMHRRTHHNQALLHPEEELVPTQEFIRRVVENGDHADADDDFMRDPWLCALEFLREGFCFDLDFWYFCWIWERENWWFIGYLGVVIFRYGGYAFELDQKWV